MRLLIVILLFLQLGACAQPTFCFTLAEDRQELRPFQGSVSVVQHYRERVPYVGFKGSYLGPLQVLELQGGPLFRDSTQAWVVYNPVEAMAESFVLVVQGKDTLCIDLPEDPTPLIDRAWRRGERDTPEVIRLRKGTYPIEQRLDDPWVLAAANTIAQRLLAEDEATYKQELADLETYYRDLPPPTPPAPPDTPPPPLTEEEILAYWSEQPTLKEARISGVNSDTVRVTFTGRVMLNGGCGSNTPMFGLEQRIGAGWVERVPVDRSQMDCGLPWGDWEEHVLAIPLRWWVGRSSPAGKAELEAGTYRLVFIGGDRQELRTSAFELGR